ncbi:LacI family DNA-binding transcriptional regulator [Paractinoplanes rishiriensis]|nr:LacI family DNA-binding transcriptional regulator [Actinoplanes rishiriensis]
MRDVAQLAGVSHQTVSRVVNGHAKVRDETRQRVLDAMRSLNYRRNLAARTLVTRRSYTLGIIGYETTLFGPASMLHGIESAAREAGYLVSIATMPELTGADVLEAVDRLAHHVVDGVIAIAPNEAVADALDEASAGLCCVAVGGAGPAGVTPRVCIDNAAGGRLATRHLLDLGHRTVHHVSGPLDWPEARERLGGWQATLRAAGRPVPPVAGGGWDAASGYQQGLRLADDPSVTAVFCANDRIALGVLRALHEAGRSVPDEVSVVGFDDTPEAGYFFPPLTTIRQDFAELGRRSLALLLERLAAPDDRAARQPTLLTPELIVRTSRSPRHRA